MGTLTSSPEESRAIHGTAASQFLLETASSQYTVHAADLQRSLVSYYNVRAHGRQRLRQGRVGDVQPRSPQHPDRGESGGPGHLSQRIPAGRPRQERQEVSVRPGGAGSSGGEGGPVHEGNGGQQADSHRGAGQVPPGAGQEGVGGRQTERSPPQD